MPEGDRATVERIIANTINETARGDPDALAPRIVAALTAAGFRIVAASGRGDSALARQLAETRPLYRSPNGDSWCLARDPATDGELNELGDMLVRGVPMEEIARRLRRDYGEVRDKVAEVGRACRVDRGLRRA